MHDGILMKTTKQEHFWYFLNQASTSI